MKNAYLHVFTDEVGADTVQNEPHAANILTNVKSQSEQHATR